MHPMLETLTLGSDITDGGPVDTAAGQFIPISSR